MTHSVQKRAEYFSRLQKKIDTGKFKFDVNKASFGFKHLRLLTDEPESLKSYPCIVYNKSSNIEYAVKVIPLIRRFRVKGKAHPAEVEVKLLKEFTECVRYGFSPHMTYHIAHYTLPNNARSLREFPLKRLAKYVEPKSIVLVAEYVQGGSIEDWMREETGTIEHWRYIVFAVCWTLMILQDRYRCIHNDLHFGNVLLDTRFRDDQKPLAYHLVGDDGLDVQFKVVVPGIMPKMWDWEVASSFKPGFTHENAMAAGMTHFPVEFDPHYDLHYFLTTLLEQDVPDELVDLIYDLYGDDFVPSEEAKEKLDEKFRRHSGSSCSSATTQASFDSDVWEIDTSADSSGSDDDSDHDDITSEDSCYGSDDNLDVDAEIEEGNESDDEAVVDVEGEVKTEYLMGERMLNGAWRKAKKPLPTPLSLLQHEFFSCYRDDSNKNRAAAVTFRHIREPSSAWKLEGDKYI